MPGTIGISHPFAYPLDKAEVAVGVEKYWVNRAVGAGGLAYEVGDVIFEVARLRVHLRVGGHFDMKVVAGFFGG